LWNFESKNNGYICIENTSKTKVLQATSDGKVIQEVFEEGKAEQLWKKGEPMAHDYFTLESHSEVPKVITAISESVLEIKGNITLRWIVTVKSRVLTRLDLKHMQAFQIVYEGDFG
jgi:hypothetical protein